MAYPHLQQFRHNHSHHQQQQQQQQQQQHPRNRGTRPGTQPWRRNPNRPRSRIPLPPPAHNRVHYSRPSRPPQTRGVGVLKWFDAQKQYGFISSSQRVAHDLFVHESAFIGLTSAQIMASIGQSVQFTIDSYVDHRSGRSKEKAVSVSLLQPQSAQSDHHQMRVPTQTHSVIGSNLANSQTHSQSVRRPRRESKGTLLWFNEKDRFGFIQCDVDLHSECDPGDLFVYESELLFDKDLLYKGMRLRFAVEMYRDHRGRTKKKAVAVAMLHEPEQERTEEQTAQMRSEMVSQTESPTKSSPQKHNPNQSQRQQTEATPVCVTCKYKGLLLWFNEQKKHGFIACDDEGVDDVFVYETDFRFPRYLIAKDLRLVFDIKAYHDYKGRARRKAINVKMDHQHVQVQTPTPTPAATPIPQAQHPSAMSTVPVVPAYKETPSPLSVLLPRVMPAPPSILRQPAPVQLVQPAMQSMMMSPQGRHVTFTFPVVTHIIPAPQFPTVLPSALAPQFNPNPEARIFVPSPQPLPPMKSMRSTHTLSSIQEIDEIEEMDEEKDSFDYHAQVPTPIVPEPVSEPEPEPEPVQEVADEPESVSEPESDPVIESVEVDVQEANLSPSVSPSVSPKRKKRKLPKLGINIESLLRSKMDSKSLAKQMFSVVFPSKSKSKSSHSTASRLELLFQHLLLVPKTFRTSLISALLELLSMIESKQSILSLIGHFRAKDLMHKYLHKLLTSNTTSTRAEFKTYGLLSLFPSDTRTEHLIDDLISRNASAAEFIKNGCFEHANYETMHAMLEHLLPRHLQSADSDMYELMGRMVSNSEVCDIENNDKVVLMSLTASIVSAKKGELADLVRELVSHGVVSLEVIDAWRMDEFDSVTEHKKEALMALTDLVHALQNKEIKDNEHGWLRGEVETEVEDEEEEDAWTATYIGSEDLMQINLNRHANHLCPWRHNGSGYGSSYSSYSSGDEVISLNARVY